MEKKRIIKDPDVLYAYVEDCRTKWQSYAGNEIERVMKIRDYFYDSNEESNKIDLSESIKGLNKNKITLSPIRNTLNRAKSDIRDQQPTLDVSQKRPSNDDDVVKVSTSILEGITLNNDTNDNLYFVADNIIDMDYAVAQLVVETKFNEQDKQIQSELVVESIYDLNSVTFDCSVPLQQINKKGNYVSISREINKTDEHGKEKTEIIIEHFEKIWVSCTYGKREDAISGKMVTEKAVKKYKYTRKTKVREVEFIAHWVFSDGKLIINEQWPYKLLPFILGTAIGIDRFKNSNSSSERLTLVPFAEGVIRAQDMLNQAATMMAVNLSQTRGSSKVMYTPEQTKGYDKEWKYRNTSDTDLPFNILKDKDGNPLPIKPEFVPDTPTSPVVSEIIQTMPGQIQQLLGQEHEETINYNKSGEAIKAMQVIASKNVKLYLEGYERFLGWLGICIEHYLPIVYDTPQYIQINVAGKTKVMEINSRKDNMISSLLESFKIDISLGSTKQAKNDKTIAGLGGLWQVTMGTPIGMQIVGATVDIYAQCLDSNYASDISRRLSVYLPAEIKALIDGENEEKLQAQKSKAEQEQLTAAAEQAQRAERADLIKADASRMSGEGRLLSGQAAMIKAQKEGVVPSSVHVNENINANKPVGA